MSSRVVVAALALALIIGAGAYWISSDGSFLPEAEPRFQVSPSSLSFDSVPMFKFSSNAAVVTNISDEVVVIDSMSIDAPFQARTGRLTLQPGQSVQLPVTFAPRELGPATGKFTVTSGDESHVVALAAESTGLPSI